MGRRFRSHSGRFHGRRRHSSFHRAKSRNKFSRESSYNYKINSGVERPSDSKPVSSNENSLGSIFGTGHRPFRPIEKPYNPNIKRTLVNSQESYEDEGINKPKKEKIKKSIKLSTKHKIAIGIVITSLVLVLIHPILLILEIIILCIVWYMGSNRNCPICKKYFARVLQEKEVLDTYTDYVTTNNVTRHRDNQGNFIGTSTNNTVKPVAMARVQNHWKCKYCGHEWIGRQHGERM